MQVHIKTMKKPLFLKFSLPPTPLFPTDDQATATIEAVYELTTLIYSDPKNVKIQSRNERILWNGTKQFFALASSKLQPFFFFSSFFHKNYPFMERVNQYNNFVLLFSLIVTLGLVSFSLCLAAEFNKSKKKDLRFNDKFCYLPGSPAFGFGIAALICLVSGQVIGNFFICRMFSARDHRSGCDDKIKRPTIAAIFLVFSWIIFGVCVILISAATSMSRNQSFGEGWLDGECYIVKSGVYIGSGILAVLTLGLTLGSDIVMIRQCRVEENRKVQTQTK